MHIGLFTGAVYDYRKQYDDVFYVIGVIYVIDALLFSCIPLIQYLRGKKSNHFGNCNEFTGIISIENKQTFKVPQRSVSNSSLVKEGEVTAEYGTLMSAGKDSGTLSNGQVCH